MDTYVFVLDEHDFKALTRQIKAKVFDTKSSVVVLWNHSMEPFFKGRDIRYLLLSDYSKKIDFKQLRKNTLELIKHFPHKKILDGKSLVELLEYEGYSLWWFVRQGFYEYCLDILKNVQVIKLLLNEKNIKKILLLNNDKEFISIVKESTDGLKVRIKVNSRHQRFNILDYPKKIKINISEYVPRLIRVAQGFFKVMKINKKNGKKNILLMMHSADLTNLTDGIIGNTNFYTVLRAMNKNKDYNIIPIDNATTKDAAWKGTKKNTKFSLPYDFFIFKSFFDFEIKKNLKRFRFRLRSLWGKLDKSDELQKVLIYEKINLYNIVKPSIKSYFFKGFSSFLGAIRNIEISKKLIRDCIIDATACIDENASSRFLVFASDMCNIPSIGLQHGAIYTHHISYNYSKKDLYCYKNKLNCILPDKTAVFGKKFKNLLIENGNYKPSQIVVTGQPRTDILFENKDKYSKKALCNKFGIDYKKKLVVYASQRLKDPSELKKSISEIVKSLKEINNAELIIKLHPAEENSFYNKLLSNLKYKAIITKNADIYELLFCSDLLISISSTVILEALIIGKPAIQLNLITNYDIFEDCGDKLFKKVVKESYLTQTIKDFFNVAVSGKIVEERKNFILDFYNGIDGKATDRFIQALDNLLKNYKR